MLIGFQFNCMSSLNHFTKNQFSYNRYKTQYTTNFKILNQPLEDSSRIYVVSTDLVVLVQTGSLLLSGLSDWSDRGFLQVSLKHGSYYLGPFELRSTSGLLRH